MRRLPWIFLRLGNLDGLERLVLMVQPVQIDRFELVWKRAASAGGRLRFLF